MSDFSNGFGAIFRQAFVSKRGNLADALFAIADAIQELGSHPTQRLLENPHEHLQAEFDYLCAECGELVKHI